MHGTNLRLDRRGAVEKCITKPDYLVRLCEHEVVRNYKPLPVPTQRARIWISTRTAGSIEPVGVGKIKGTLWDWRIHFLTMSARDLLDPLQDMANVRVGSHSVTNTKHKKAVE
jgi:hypothetical protein